jgi:nucleoprotein TPR
LDALKYQLETAQSTAREKSAQAETAHVKLTASEASWRQQKDVLDKELSDLSSRYGTSHASPRTTNPGCRCKDLAEQNSVLHQHLESVSSQAARIRQAADSTDTMQDSDAGAVADAKVSELRSVVAYLRKEKEIVELQLVLAKQENTRLKAQVDHLSHSLEEARATLAEVRLPSPCEPS